MGTRSQGGYKDPLNATYARQRVLPRAPRVAPIRDRHVQHNKHRRRRRKHHA